ncbi:hypothetical protein HY839_01865 [Candidatus Azambacteria bacterium]|nr:hypothetical protein [Candidatus Azambacteria bacterium]
MEITEKKLQAILIKGRKEFQRYVGALGNNFSSQVKLVAESLSGIQNQLVAIREMVAKNTEDIETMKRDLHLIKHDLKRKVGMTSLQY